MRKVMQGEGKKIWATVVFLSCLLSVLFLALSITPVMAQGIDKQQQLVEKAKLSFDKFVADPPSDWFVKNIADIKAILIFPQVLKGALLWGGAGGSGVMLVRNDETGEWSNPAFYTNVTVSFGLQIGAKSSEMLVFVMRDRGVESFYSSSFKLGADASAAFGPAGEGAKGATSLTLSADILGFDRSQGVFGGISAEGAIFKVRYGANDAYYGEGTRPTDIFVKGGVGNPGAAALREAVAKATAPRNPEAAEE